MPAPLLVTFGAGVAGDWRIKRIEAVRGAGLERANRPAVVEATGVGSPAGAQWTSRGLSVMARAARDRAALEDVVDVILSVLESGQPGSRRPRTARR